MKTLVAGVSLLSLLLGCGAPGAETGPENRPGHETSLQDIQEISLGQTDGFTFSTRYRYVPAEGRLTGQWSTRGPAGSRSGDGKVQLTPAQALHLESLLSGVQLDIPVNGAQGCINDVPTLHIEFVDTAGASRRYRTNPENDSCGPGIAFAAKEDVQAAFDACRELLPPSL